MQLWVVIKGPPILDTKTCEVDSIFPPNDLSFGSNTNMNYDITYICSDFWQGQYLVFISLLMGEGMASVGLPFVGTGCPEPDVGKIYLVWNDSCVRYCLYMYLHPKDVPFHSLLFRKADWTN